MRRLGPVLLLAFLLLLSIGASLGASSARDLLARHGFAVSHCNYRSGAGCPNVPAPGTCHLHGASQDRSCTPGVLNPKVRQRTIFNTICRSGYTTKIRPPTSYTDPLKLQLMSAYGAGSDTSAFELDHLISLELGGAPSDPRNLWPESHYKPSWSYRKDGLENSLHAKVCNGTISLRRAQRQIVNWTAFISTSGGGGPAPPSPPTSNCDPAYPTVCIPPPPPDLNCGDISYRNFTVLAPDPHHFDSDGDGVGCET